MHTSIRFISLSSLMLLVAACANMSSQDIETSGISAYITVQSNDSSSIDVSANLTAGSGFGATYISLSGGDELDSLYLGSQKKMGRHKDVLGIISYDSNYNSSQPYTTDSTVQVSFYRPNHTDAPNSTVTLPDPITTFVIADNTVTVDQDVLLSWDTIIGKTYSLIVKINMNGCMNDKGESASVSRTAYLSDSGSYTFKVTDMLISGYSCPAGSTGDVVVKRVKYGSLDPAYGSGSIKAEYLQKTSFTVQ